MTKKQLRRRKKKLPSLLPRTEPGAPPGTLQVPANALLPTIHVIKYTEETLVEKTLNNARDVADFVTDDGVTWVNVEGLGDIEVLHRLGEIFGLHQLALEDMLNVPQRAKVEEYAEHLFIVLQMVTLREHVESEPLCMFLGRHFVLTFQERPGDCLDPVRERLRKDRGHIRKAGADYLAYALIDAVVDAYFPIVDACGERIEWLDDRVSANHWPHFMHEIHEVRGNLMTLRRSIRPLRDALVLLMPDPHSLISENTQFYLRDCYDHTIQLIELLDTYRELCSDLREFYMSTINNRMNEIIKVLTIIATIFIPLSFIAGIYGMNFNTRFPGNMPELNWPFGYVFALSLMGGVALGLLVFIWRKGWLGRGDKLDKEFDKKGQGDNNS